MCRTSALARDGECDDALAQDGGCDDALARDGECDDDSSFISPGMLPSESDADTTAPLVEKEESGELDSAAWADVFPPPLLRLVDARECSRPSAPLESTSLHSCCGMSASEEDVSPVSRVN
jgi:hypothetical protein